MGIDSLIDSWVNTQLKTYENNKELFDPEWEPDEY